MKGVIKPDHIPVNKYQLVIIGLLPLTPTIVSGMEDELQTVTLPDRTEASGGNRTATEIEISIPMHHTAEIAACEVWYIEAQEPVSPAYKKAGTLIMLSNTGNIIRSYSLLASFIKKRALPDLDMSDDGEMAVVVYTISVDNLIPL